jgi:hypothetical protein
MPETLATGTRSSSVPDGVERVLEQARGRAGEQPQGVAEQDQVHQPGLGHAEPADLEQGADHQVAEDQVPEEGGYVEERHLA